MLGQLSWRLRIHSAATGGAIPGFQLRSRRRCCERRSAGPQRKRAQGPMQRPDKGSTRAAERIIPAKHTSCVAACNSGGLGRTCWLLNPGARSRVLRTGARGGEQRGVIGRMRIGRAGIPTASSHYIARIMPSGDVLGSWLGHSLRFDATVHWHQPSNVWHLKPTRSARKSTEGCFEPPIATKVTNQAAAIGSMMQRLHATGSKQTAGH